MKCRKSNRVEATVAISPLSLSLSFIEFCDKQDASDEKDILARKVSYIYDIHAIAMILFVSRTVVETIRLII